MADQHHEPLIEVLEHLLREQRKLVANTAQLAEAVSANQAAVAANTTAVDAAVEALTNDADQAAVDTATTAVEASTAQVTANTAALNNVVNSPVAPTVTAVSPTEGPAAGGTAITLTGTSFTGATAVTVGTHAATDVVVVSDTEITAVTPEGTDGTSPEIWVTAPAGENLASGITFTYAG